jgi:hypothetical protein
VIATGAALMLTTALTGCAMGIDLAPARRTGPQPLHPECQAETFDFVGRGTFAGLGLETATPVSPPNPHREAMIWVTHDLKEYDPGEPGGPVVMTRMMCFEFDDGTGGSEWPVDASWQPPPLP